MNPALLVRPDYYSSMSAQFDEHDERSESRILDEDSFIGDQIGENRESRKGAGPHRGGQAESD